MLILATIFFLVVPIMSIPILIIAFIKDSKYRKIYGFLLAISLGIVSFEIDVKKLNLDLRVYYGQMEMLKFMNFSKVLDILILEKEPITNLMFFIIAKIGVYPLWQFITTFINYFIIFFILSDYAKIKKIGNKTFAIILIFTVALMNNIFLLTGIRNTCALMIYLYLLYSEYIKQKKGIIYKILYIVPVLIHMSMIIGIIIRILINIKIKKYRIFVIIGFIIYASSPSLILQLSGLLGKISIFSDLIDKLQVYLFNSMTFNFNSIAHLFLLIYFMFYYYRISKKRKQEQIKITNLCNALELVLIFNICSFSYWDIFLRWSDISIILFSLFLMDNVKMIKMKKSINMLIMFCFLISYIYIQNVNLKELNISKNLNEYCYKNIVTIFNDKKEEI